MCKVLSLLFLFFCLSGQDYDSSGKYLNNNNKRVLERTLQKKLQEWRKKLLSELKPYPELYKQKNLERVYNTEYLDLLTKQKIPLKKVEYSIKHKDIINYKNDDFFNLYTAVSPTIIIAVVEKMDEALNLVGANYILTLKKVKNIKGNLQNKTIKILYEQATKNFDISHFSKFHNVDVGDQILIFLTVSYNEQKPNIETLINETKLNNSSSLMGYIAFFNLKYGALFRDEEKLVKSEQELLTNRRLIKVSQKGRNK